MRPRLFLPQTINLHEKPHVGPACYVSYNHFPFIRESWRAAFGAQDDTILDLFVEWMDALGRMLHAIEQGKGGCEHGKSNVVSITGICVECQEEVDRWKYVSFDACQRAYAARDRRASRSR